MLKHLIDTVLVEDAIKLVSIERKTTVEILKYLEEIDRRQLYLEYQCPSMIQFCIKILKYSEGSAYRRLQAARLTREIPESLPLLKSGELTLTNMSKANEFFRAEGIKEQNQKKDVLKDLVGKSSRDAERELCKKASDHSTFRRKNMLKRATTSDWELTVTISDGLKNKLDHIKDMKSHSLKRWEDVLDFAAELSLKEITKKPNPRLSATPSRSPTPAMKKVLTIKADGQCQHPGCRCRKFLQIDHIDPICRGGKTALSNLQVLCTVHNRRKGSN